MAKKTFHSKQDNTKVYHNTTKCTEGNNIEKRNFARGTGGKDLCKHCSKIRSK